jgi:hypothetical protein
MKDTVNNEELTPCGSSETTRKAPSFSTEDFMHTWQAPHVPRVPEALQWFVGFLKARWKLIFSQVTDTNTRLRFTIKKKKKTLHL